MATISNTTTAGSLQGTDNLITPTPENPADAPKSPSQASTTAPAQCGTTTGGSSPAADQGESSRARAKAGAQLALKVITRIVYFFMLLVVANLIMYSMVNLAPGSPMESAYTSPELRMQMEEAVGLSEPFLVRFGTWLGKALTFDFGFSYSIQLGVPVIDMIGTSFLRTISLLFIAVAVSFILSLITSTLLAANRKGGPLLKYVVMLISAVPVFLLCYWTIRGVNLMVVNWVDVGSRPDWFPLPMITDSYVPYLFAGLTLAVGDGMLSDLTRVLSLNLRSLGRQRYIHSARARGASPLRHGTRAFSIEATSMMTSRLVSLLGAAVIVEKLFSIEGIGYLLWEAALQRDYSVVVGIAFLSTVVVIAARLVADLYQLAMDPRVRSK